MLGVVDVMSMFFELLLVWGCLVVLCSGDWGCRGVELEEGGILGVDFGWLMVVGSKSGLGEGCWCGYVVGCM